MAIVKKDSYTGAEIVVKCLEEQNVTHVFGFPGGAVIPLYDAFYRLDPDGDFNHIVPTHEQHGVHAADGYARRTGKVGVVVATSGPGATNTVTGIATAFLDSVPMVVFTGQVAQVLLGKDSFQEIDVVGVTRPITKHNYLVENVEQLPYIIREAFELASTGRPGPVLIDLPKNIQNHVYGAFEPRVIEKEEIVYDAVDITSIEQAVEIIKEAKNPVVYAGGGILKAEASKELLDFIDKSGIPIANSLMGLGGFPRDHELSLGLVGMHGFKQTNMAVINSDLIIAVGARFSDRVIGKPTEFQRTKKIIHFDIDSKEFGKNIHGNCYVKGHVKKTLPMITKRIDSKRYPEWYQQIEDWTLPDSELNDFSPIKILNEINKYFPDSAVATEVGQHQMWTAQHWKFRHPYTFITSGGLGTMGYGMGAAIGAQLGDEQERVVLIAGDGSFRMNSSELATLKKYNLPVVVFIMNNSTLGMVRQWQKLFFNERYAVTDIAQVVDYVKLAEANGIKGFRAMNLPELTKVLDEVKDINEPILVDVVISNDENVFPIVPPGASIDEIVYE